MPNFVEFTAANGGFPVLVNPDAVVSLEPAGYGTALALTTRDTVRVAEPLDVVRERLVIVTPLAELVEADALAELEPAPEAAKREKK